MYFPVIFVIKSNRSWLLLALGLFLFSALFFFIGINYLDNSSLEGLTGDSLEEMEGLFDFILGRSPLITSLIIFVNNAITALQMLIFGIFLGISPLFTVLLNGALLGGLLGIIATEGGIIGAILALIVGILPHGIPELFAVFIAAALGLKLGYHLIFPLPKKDRWQSVVYIWKEIISVLPLVVALLFIAAFIEVFITMPLLNLFNGIN